MRKTSYSSEVHASLETVWKVLVEKVEQPERHRPEAIRSRIVQQDGNGVLREALADALLLKDQALLDQGQGEIRCEMVDHPQYAAEVVLKVVASSVQNPEAPQLLTVEVRWHPKDEDNVSALEAQLRGKVRKEVLALKERAEALDAGQVRSGYAFGSSVAAPYAETLAVVRKELAKEGFGILCEIDVRQKFQEKLQKDFRNYIILGACHPALAYQAFGAELNIGTLLPCNVVVYSDDEARTMVMMMDPVATLSLVGNPQLAELAGTVKEKLVRVLAALRSR